MKILCINPNRSMEITEIIDKRCKTFASGNVEVVTKCLSDGPESLETYEQTALALQCLMKTFVNYRDEFDGFIIACHSDIGVDFLREQTRKPVVGIGEASMLFATLLGDKFSILSLTRKAIPKKDELVRKYGLEYRCVSIRETDLKVASDPRDQISRLIEEGRKAVNEDKAEVLILGCAGMGEYEREIEEKVGVPVIDGVVSSMMLVESLIRYGKNTSKIGKYR